jgi:hypothetical protein
MKIKDVLKENTGSDNTSELEKKLFPEQPKDFSVSGSEDMSSSADQEDTVDTDDTDDNSNNVEAFKETAGSIGDGLYALTMYDYSNDFAGIGPDSGIKSIIETFRDQPGVEKYLATDINKIVDRHVIAAVILNENNDQAFAFYAGKGVLGTSPDSLADMVRKGIIDADQKNRLQEIINTGAEYQDAVENTESWKPGYDADNEEVYDAMRALISDLNLNTIEKISFSGPSKYDLEQKAYFKELDKIPFADRVAAYKKEQEKENPNSKLIQVYKTLRDKTEAEHIAQQEFENGKDLNDIIKTWQELHNEGLLEDIKRIQELVKF